MSAFKTLPEFPRYEINRNGSLRIRATKRPIQPVPVRQGERVYNLALNGARRCRTARLLVKSAFGKTWPPKWNPWRGWGEQIGSHRLTEAEVHEIRALLATGETQKSIAALFKTSQSHVWRIKHGLAWKNLGEK